MLLGDHPQEGDVELERGAWDPYRLEETVFSQLHSTHGKRLDERVKAKGKSMLIISKSLCFRFGWRASSQGESKRTETELYSSTS